MTKQLIAFALDDALAVSKSEMHPRMSALLAELLNHYDVCVTSGVLYDYFESQILRGLEATPAQLSRLHLMPTCGTRYYRYSTDTEQWELQYAEDMSESDKTHIIEVLEAAAREVGVWEERPYGEIIEDRLSQITYSALGQKAPTEKKYEWANAHAADRQRLVALVASKLPGFEVRLGGTTSVDVTPQGVDKSYGLKRLMAMRGLAPADVLYIGDKLQEGNMNYPVKLLGVDCVEVEGWPETAKVVEGIIGVS